MADDDKCGAANIVDVVGALDKLEWAMDVAKGVLATPPHIDAASTDGVGGTKNEAVVDSSGDMDSCR